MKNEIIFDAEFDGLNPTKIWCFSYENLTTGEQHTTQDYNEIRKILQDTGSYFIGHNITRFDVVHLGRILEIDLSHLNLIDTLPLSWYLWPERHKHGIEEWGDYFGLKKPQVDDWFNLDIEVYKHRCREDVIINRHFWQLVKDKLFLIYKDSKSAFELIKYLQFKMNCAQLQEENRWKLDVPKTQKSLEALKKIKDEKVKSLGKALPKVPKYAKRFRPRIYYSKSGDRTKRALEWEELLKELGLDVETTEEVEVIVDWMEPNPSSHSQLKGWLFSLGWEPCTYKQNKKKEEIPQITKEGSSDLVPSVLKLKEKAPSIVELQGLFTINHRIGILEGFLASMDEEGFVRAKIAGLTNTLRFKHSEIVNLPGVDRPYGAYIRPCLIAEDGWELCGADMASLEDRTKQSFLWDYDPDYVKSMLQEDWDPHLDIAVQSKMMTQDEADFYKWYDGKK